MREYWCIGEPHRNRKHQLCVPSQVSYVAVQRGLFLCRTGFADGEGDSQDGVGSKLSCRTGSQVKLVVCCLSFVSKKLFTMRK